MTRIIEETDKDTISYFDKDYYQFYGDNFIVMKIERII